MKLKHIIYILVSPLLLVSCEDFFEKEPIGEPYREVFYNNMNELQLGLNSVYNVLARDDYQKSEYLFGEGCGDDCNRIEDKSLSSNEGRLMQFAFAPDNPLILTRWEVNYKGIYRANQIISNGQKVVLPPGETGDEDQLTPIIAQAKFLRALYYFNLVKTYGGVPIKPDVLEFSEESDNFTQPRASVEEVYQYIEKDLREAIIGLRELYQPTDFQNLGKAEKGAAVALLIKVLAYQAEPGVSHAKWHEALKFCELIVEGGFMSYRDILNYDELYEGTGWEEIKQELRLDDSETLEDGTVGGVKQYEQWISFTYDKIWTREGEHNPGSIFEVNHVESNDGTQNSANLGSNVYNALNSGSAAPKVFQPISRFKNERTYDPRLMITVIQQGDILPGGVKASVGVLPSNTGCYKWWVQPDERPQGHSSDNSRNFRILRMGEVILWYAEALNETGDPEAAVVQLNRLRERARLITESDGRWTGSTDKPDYLSPGNYLQVRDLVWEERRIEMAFEFDRFFDIVRQGNAGLLMAQFNAAFEDLYKKDFKEGINEIFPIPQNEIDFSNGVVTQNPGY